MNYEIITKSLRIGDEIIGHFHGVDSNEDIRTKFTVKLRDHLTKLWVEQ